MFFPIDLPKRGEKLWWLENHPTTRAVLHYFMAFSSSKTCSRKKTSLLPPEPGSDRAACHQCPAGGWSPCLWWQSPLAGLRWRCPPPQMTSGIYCREVTKKNGILGSSKMASWESPELNDCFWWESHRRKTLDWQPAMLAMFDYRRAPQKAFQSSQTKRSSSLLQFITKWLGSKPYP